MLDVSPTTRVARDDAADRSACADCAPATEPGTRPPEAASRPALTASTAPVRLALLVCRLARTAAPLAPTGTPPIRVAPPIGAILLVIPLWIGPVKYGRAAGTWTSGTRN